MLVRNSLFRIVAKLIGSTGARLVGAVFLFSGVMKAIDITTFSVQISYFGILRTPWAVNAVAIALVAFETVIGVMLLFQIEPRLSLIVAVGAITMFSMLVIWAWLFTDIKDCGCFGRFLEMSPAASLIKNVVLLVISLIGLRYLNIKSLPNYHAEQEDDMRAAVSMNQCAGGCRGPRLKATVATVAGVAVLTIGVAVFRSGSEFDSSVSTPAFSTGDLKQSSSNKDGRLAKYVIPFQGKELNLARGSYLVALLSDSCSHCAEIVAGLNQAAEKGTYPVVVGLILGEEDTNEQFKAEFKPAFATARIPVLEFFDLIGSAPPRFYLVNDGVAVRYWDSALPPKDELSTHHDSHSRAPYKLSSGTLADSRRTGS